MELFEAIRGRRSVGLVKDEPVDKERIEQMLEAANWAPCHHLTEPWRFYVMTGEGRNVLAKAFADIAVEQAMAAGTLTNEQEFRTKQGAKAFRSPVVIAVAVSPSDKPQAVRIEELAAVHAAVQNMLLAAHALGLGAVWRTGEPAYHPTMRGAFGLKEGEELVGFVYVGVPQLPLPVKSRSPVQPKTVWIESNG
ncbi:nitroreductase family protein [Paenibacillus ginsengarvi]|uniref:Putative NAD(P)H nitroreductase n=1 Tax=Paenibacillus ginsengarvi TaxID=400777 RepID=A0A3B0CMI9_9BACL|nr:nitroreductase [Paenibacillus ginsengarvi]RKN86392.1 nitroreductase [Paenibacillus ginsengarvi]